MYGQFVVWDVAEIVPPDAAIDAYLQTELTVGRYDPAFVAAAATELGWDALSDLLATGQPISIRGRRGYFGEVVSANLVQELQGYEVPVKKFRFAPHPDVSPPATDILALKTTAVGEVAEVCLLEVKLRTNRSRSIAVIALDQLRKDWSPEYPNITRFVLERLYEAGSDLFAPFARYLRSRQSGAALETSRLYLVFDRAAWSEDALVDLDATDVTDRDPLAVHVVLIDELGPLTDRVFEALGARVSDDD